MHHIESRRRQRSDAYQQELQSIYRAVIKRLQKGRTYRASGINTQHLGSELGIDARKLHRAIKTINGTSLTDIINNMRLDDAKKRLSSPQWNSYTIEEIGLSVGFVSRQSFHLVFQREVGCPPAEFRKQQQNHSSNKAIQSTKV